MAFTASKELINRNGDNNHYNNDLMTRIFTFITTPYTTAKHSSTPLFH